MAIFAATGRFVRLVDRPFRARRASREAWFAFVRDAPAVGRRAVVARRGALAERLDRFGLRVVALGPSSDLLLLAASALLRERCDLFAVLAFVRVGLLCERAWASATLICLRPEFLAVAGAALAVLGVFDALAAAAGFFCVDARGPSERSPLARR